MAKKLSFGLSSPIICIALGALLAIFKSQMLSWAMTVAGIVFIVLGALDLSKKRTISGAINLIIGIAILVLGWALASIVLLVLGVLLAIKGLMDLVGALKVKKKSILRIVASALTMILGLALAFGNGLNDLIFAVGILLIVDGILGLIGSRK